MVNIPLTRRLIALEHARGARRVEYRTYVTYAEAEAASDLPEGVTVVAIITGVPRSPALDPARQ